MESPPKGRKSILGRFRGVLEGVCSSRHFRVSRAGEIRQDFKQFLSLAVLALKSTAEASFAYKVTKFSTLSTDSTTNFERDVNAIYYIL